MHCHRGLLAAGALLLGAAPARAQETGQPTTYPNVRIQGRAQFQGYYLDNEDYGASVGPQSNFFLRRVRIEARGQISERVSFFIQPSYEGGRALDLDRARGGVRLRDAYIDIRLTDAKAPTGLTVRFGQEKKPFGRYELTSSNNLVTMERGAGRGLMAAATNDLFERHGFLATDVGMAAIVTGFDDAVTLRAGVYNGQGESLNDVNNAKSVGARATVAVTKKLNLGGSVFSHEGIVAREAPAPGPDSSARNTAFNLDGQWGAPGEPGLYGLADFMTGQASDEEQTSMRGLNVLAAYHARLRSPGLLFAVEPAVRFDVADPNTDADDDGATLLTALVGLYFSPRAQLRIGLERQAFQQSGRDPIVGVRSAVTVNF